MSLVSAKNAIRNPGASLSKHGERTRRVYKSFCDSLLHFKRKRLRRLLRELPALNNEARVSRDVGYCVLPPMFCESINPVLLRAQEIIQHGKTAGGKKAGKARLTHLLQKSDLAVYPEFLNFALAPKILAAAADYLGELPLLTAAFLWHSQPIVGTFSNSQLFHLDHDDIRQFKVFVYLSDVDDQSGPLTVLPAKLSNSIRDRLAYTRLPGKGKVPDDIMKPLIPEGGRKALTGPKGTIAFVDTSQVFHYGSRVASKDRYVLMLQYVTLTNFIVNPFYTFTPYPYVEFAKDTHSQLQQAVLGKNLIHTFHSGSSKSLDYSD